MVLLIAFLIISFEALTEGLLKRFNALEWINNKYLQWVIAIFLFVLYFILAYNFQGYYVETWKIIAGFIFVRFAIFDVLWNLANGQRWNYYGTTKWYDRIMFKLGSWGWFMKFVLGIVGVVFLMGWT